MTNQHPFKISSWQFSSAIYLSQKVISRLPLLEISFYAWFAPKTSNPSDATTRIAYQLYINISAYIWSCCFWLVSIQRNLSFVFLVTTTNIACLNSSSAVIFILFLTNKHYGQFLFLSPRYSKPILLAKIVLYLRSSQRYYSFGEQCDLPWLRSYIFRH